MKTKIVLLSLLALPLLTTASPLLVVISITGILYFLLWAVIVCSFAWLLWWLVGKLPFGTTAQQILRWGLIVIAIIVVILILINFVSGGNAVTFR
jgi:hypothetical protein